MESYRDFTVGLFILASIGTIIGLFVITSNALDVRQEIYMRADAADGLNEDTRVFLQGLQIGTVTEVNARVDAQGVSFVAELRLQRAYPDGTPLQLPVGTRAVIAAPLPISAAEVDLEIPQRTDATGFLQPGDTIDSDRIPSAMDLLGEVATELKAEVVQTLALTHTLIEESTARMTQADEVIELAEGILDATAPRIEEALQMLATSLERTDQILSEISPRVGPMQDSLMATLSHARLILSSFDTLATTAHGLLSDNRSVVLEALERLNHTTLLLDYFAEQITRRPTRLLTGVELPPPDTTEARR